MSHFQRGLFLLAAILVNVSVIAQFPSVVQAQRKEPSASVIAKGNEVLGQVNSETKLEMLKENAWPWSGQYYAGDGLGFQGRIAIAPLAGVVFWRFGDTGLHDLNYGSFEEKEGYIHLNFVEENVIQPNFLRGMHPVLVPVRWGDQRFLIPENEIVDFCNHINSGKQNFRRVALFFRQVDDKDKKAGGFPEVPAKYKTYLLDKPVFADVVGMGKTVTVQRADGTTRQETEVRLNQGKANGLLVGMEVYHSGLPDLRVTEVTETSCLAKPSDTRVQVDPPPIGTNYSTRAPVSMTPFNKPNGRK